MDTATEEAIRAVVPAEWLKTVDYWDAIAGPSLNRKWYRCSIMELAYYLGRGKYSIGRAFENNDIIVFAMKKPYNLGMVFAAAHLMRATYKKKRGPEGPTGTKLDLV